MSPPTFVRRICLVAIAVVAIAVVPRDAFADSLSSSRADEVEEVAPQPKAKRWYGYQTLAVDGAALGLTAFGLSKDLSGLTTIGLGTYALGPPIVHMAHGKVGTGFASLGIRVVAPIGGAAVGFGVGYLGGVVLTGEPIVGILLGVGGFVLGGALGYLGAILIDGAALAYDDPKATSSEKKSSMRMHSPKLQLVPTFAIGRDNAGMGVAGTF